MLLELKSDWKVDGIMYKQGCLICIDYEKFLEGDRHFDILFEPEERSSLISVSNTKSYLLLNKLINVQSALLKVFLKNRNWLSEKVNAPDYGTITVESTDDFYSVSKDLIKRKVSSPEHLGIMGGSNGGLLVGVAFTQHPELYNGVVCSAPLLDMKRYNKLFAGASWMGEYGNPDVPEEWEFIKKYSPFHNVHESKRYPKVFFTTTTRDDRFHPVHARKMAAKMEDQGHDFFYFENIEGGHGTGVTNEQRAFMMGLEITYLHKMLK